MEGEIKGERQLKDHLLKDGKTGMVKCVRAGTAGAKEARLTTSPLARKEGLTLTQVQLFTGRSHQIRVQHANAGHPLWGDMRYGHGKPGRQIALWAWALKLEHPTKKEEMSFFALPPEEGAWRMFSFEIAALAQQSGANAGEE